MIYRRKTLDADGRTDGHTLLIIESLPLSWARLKTSKDVGTHVNKTVQSTVDSPLLAFGSRSVNARVILGNVVP